MDHVSIPPVRVVYENPVVRVEAEAVTGRGGASAEFVRLRMPDWATVVAVTPDERVVLVRQPRWGTGRTHLETPGGVVDPGEAPLDGIRRELLEETGYAAGSWHDLGAVYPNPALQDNRCHLFLARGAERAREPTPDPFERIAVELVALRHVPALLADGRVDHALAVAALQRVLLRV
jgi:ADP-ribose pyrophosphatase